MIRKEMRKIVIIYIVVLLSCLGLRAQNTADSGQFLDAAREYAEGRYLQAQEKFLVLLDSAPDDDAVNYYLGLCELALGENGRAAEHLTRATQLDSSNAWYLNALATLYSNEGDRASLADVCEKLVKMSPALYNTPNTLTLIADARFQQKRDSVALAYYNQALELDPSYAPAELGKIELLRMTGSYPDFFVTLGHFIDNENVRADIKSDYLSMIVDNLDSKFWWVWGEQLKLLVDKCLGLYPEDLKSQELKIKLLSIESRWDEVLSACARLAESAARQGNKEKQVFAYSYEGDVSYQNGDQKRAFKAYEKALKINPDYAPVLNNYAYYLSLKKRSLRKALKMSRRAVEQEPDNATYLDTCGWILYLLHKPQEAKPLFKHAMIYGGKESAVVLEHYSKVLETLGETDLASYYKTLSEQKAAK